MSRSVTDKSLNDIDCVLRAIENHRGQLIRRLFPNADGAYTREWSDRSVTGFWLHLSQDNQRRLVEIAREIYQPIS